MFPIAMHQLITLVIQVAKSIFQSAQIQLVQLQVSVPNRLSTIIASSSIKFRKTKCVLKWWQTKKVKLQLCRKKSSKNLHQALPAILPNLLQVLSHYLVVPPKLLYYDKNTRFLLWLDQLQHTTSFAYLNHQRSLSSRYQLVI